MRVMATQMISRNRESRLKRTTLLALLIVCDVSSQCGGLNNSSSQRYPLTGKIISVDQATQQLVVSHAEIPGYMPAMVMPFKLKDSSFPRTLAKGDVITATLVVDGHESFLAEVRVVSKEGSSDPRDAEINTLPHEGDAVPDFTLINQSGKKISIKQFRGKALLITFIYTRCPLPDYCPLMSSNFAEIDKALVKSPELYAKTHLLSISFDSQYDTPQVVRNYARAFVSDRGPRTFEHWEFATIPAGEKSTVTKFFDVFTSEGQGQITHSMSTAILLPNGLIYKSYNGNDWKPADVLTDLTSSAAGDPSKSVSQSFGR